MNKNHLTLKVILLIILNDIGDTLAQLFMKKGLAITGMNHVGFDNILEFVSRNIASPLVWAGVIVYVLNFFVWIVILYKVDLSIAMPIGSTSYIIIPLMAVVLLGEHVGLLRWAGIACIVLGINFVARSKNVTQGGRTPL